MIIYPLAARYSWRSFYFSHTFPISKILLKFYPDPWGSLPIWRPSFSNGLLQPPPSYHLYLYPPPQKNTTPATGNRRKKRLAEWGFEQSLPYRGRFWRFGLRHPYIEEYVLYLEPKWGPGCFAWKKVNGLVLGGWPSKIEVINWGS